jgi:hypothetical protein
MKRFASLSAAAGAVATVCAFALPGGAGASSSLPTFTISEAGTTGITLSSSSIPAGAYNIVMNHTGAGGGNASFQLIRLNPNEPPATAIQQGFAAVGAAHGDENALTPAGDQVLVSNGPGTVQANLTPGNWVALNVSGNGQPGFTQFTVTPSSSGAALPSAAATETAIEFGFKGPKVLHDGTVVRAVNGGYLVHMNLLVGVKSKTAGQKAVAALRAGKGMKVLGKYFTHAFVSLMGPGSTGALQQQTLNTKPGYYVELCFMNTQDGREHTQLGMERLVRVKK